MIFTFTAFVVAAAATLGVQVPALQNARVETAAGIAIERAIAGAGTETDPVWVTWRVPMVAGERDLCSTWSNGNVTVRGAALERVSEGVIPTFETPAGPVRLEAGTSLLVWLRVIDGQVERLRVLTDDCPIDAGSRRVIWLPSVGTPASITFLDSLIPSDATESESRRRIASLSITAITAIALHADAAADAVLDRRIDADGDRAVRAAAVTWTARARGRRGFQRIESLLSSATDPAFRRSLAVALAETRQPDTLAHLRSVAQADTDEHVRGEALFAYARLAPAADIPRVHAMLATDTSEEVRKRGVRGLARRATGTTDLLITLARSSPDRVVQTEAVRALGQSSDPAARNYLREVLAK